MLSFSYYALVSTIWWSFLIVLCSAIIPVENDKNIIFSVVGPLVLDPLSVAGIDAPIQVRASLYVQLAIWNAWTAYHPTASDMFGRTSPKRPVHEHSTRNKNIAMLYAFHRVFTTAPHAFGGDSTMSALNKIFMDRGLHPETLGEVHSPASIGANAGIDIAKLMVLDGWNQDGRECASAIYKPMGVISTPFADTSGYVPENSAWKLSKPFRWQPAVETNGKGFFYTQAHVVPHIGMGKTMMFTMGPRQAEKRRVRRPFKFRNASIRRAAREDMMTLRRGARFILRKSAGLTEREGLLAELFDNKMKAFRTEQRPEGVRSIVSAFRFSIMPRYMKRVGNWSLDDDMVYGLGVDLAKYDAMVTSWREKRRIDAVRPNGQTFEVALGNKTAEFSGGPGKPKVTRKVREWTPLLRTMAHSEFPSASACFCSVVVEHALQVTKGVNAIEYEDVIPQGSSSLYPGQVPARDFKLEVESLSEWSRLCGLSRIWGGVHFKEAVTAGNRLCKGIGRKGYEIAQGLLAGRVDGTWMMWLEEEQQHFWEDIDRRV